MRKANVAELKNGLSRYLAHVKAGGTVVVFERDRPVAQIVPLRRRSHHRRDGERLARLERRGVIRRSPGDFAKWLREHPPVRGASGVLKALLNERRSGW